jgi:hypothetical protein
MTAGDVERHPSDGWLILPFETGQAFERWLGAHHADQPGLCRTPVITCTC